MVVYWTLMEDSAPAESSLKLYGNVDIREAQLAFNGSEHITEIFVQEGDHVHKGQLLAQLHTELLDAQLLQANSNLLAQQLVVKKLEIGSRPEEIRKGEAELKAAQAHAKYSRDKHLRIMKLFKEKLASPEDVENAYSLSASADAQKEAVKETLALLKLGPREEDIAAARAQLTAIEAGVALAKQHLAHASLYAPAEGIIRNRILEPGEMAFPQTPVLTLAFIDPVWIRAYLPEPSLGRVKLGDKAVIRTDSYPEKKYTGWVGYISPTAEFTPKSIQTEELRTRLVYSVRIFACNPDGELRLGMPATVTIKENQKSITNSASDLITEHCSQ